MSCRDFLCTCSYLASNESFLLHFLESYTYPSVFHRLHNDTITLGQGRRPLAAEKLNPCLFTSKMPNCTRVSQSVSFYLRITT